jgi:endonuclease YncB( thermonuclease family)
MRESVLSLVAWRSVAIAPVAMLSLVPLLVCGSVSHSTPVGLVSGPAMAVDGDTLDVGGVRVRLEGIDAPEYDQSCPRAWLGSWSCGKEAQRFLARMVAEGSVSCESRGRDAYGRMLGVCSVNGKEVNAEMVRRGLAWAFVKYSKSYVDLEAEAKAARTGIWQASAEPAWTYREKRWSSAEETAPDGCAIKGNITDKGHIYHMPWSPWYRKVKIETGKGERWFCSESDATAAGWRPAMIN